MKVLQISAFAAVCLTVALGGAQAEEYMMRIATGTSSSGDNCKDYLPSWAEKIKAESGGRIGYQMFCDGTLGKMGDTINRVQAGVAEVGWDNPLVYGDRFAALGVVGLPGLFDEPKQAAGALWKAYESGLIPAVKGVKLIQLHTFGNISIWSAKEIPDPANVGGLKIGMGSKVRAMILETKGAVPLSLSVTDYYQAIARGAADGIFTTDSSILDFQMADIIKHSYRAPFGGGVAAVFMNQQWYDKLPDDLKKVIDKNIGYETSKWVSDRIWKNEQKGIQKTVDQQGMKIHKLTPEQVKTWQPAFDAAAKVWVDSTTDGAAVLEGFRKTLKTEATN